MEKALFRDIENFSTVAVVRKDWGYEVWHFNTPTLCMKTLVIYPGWACSLHWHEIKYEIFTCLDSGTQNKLYITIDGQKERLLRRGEHVIIESGVKHTFRVEGTEPAALLEFSTHHREGDSYRSWPSHNFGGGSKMDFLGQVGMLKDRKILCIGDIALDEYHRGTVTRVSPEDPSSVVLNMDPVSPDILEMTGCVGNVAANVNALGGKVAIVSVIGDDGPGYHLLEILGESNIETKYIVQTPDRATTKKTRFMVGSSHLLREDYEQTDEVESELEADIETAIQLAIDEYEPDIIYLADYDKGVLSFEIINYTIAAAHIKHIPTIADPKLRHFHAYRGVDILKPNDVRAGAAMDMPVQTEYQVYQLCDTIAAQLNCDFVLVTRGSKGMVLREKDGAKEMIPPRYVEISELSGAGDTAGAALALAVASGMTIYEAAQIANVAASVIVQKSGTAVCTPSELQAALDTE
jgi:D-beta-D-heptose 7-phosphate kinase/D-beta-D-heptose 1-phosphate adenosyltransferase